MISKWEFEGTPVDVSGGEDIGRKHTILVEWDLGQYRGLWSTDTVGLRDINNDKHGSKMVEIPNSIAQIPVPVPMSRTFWGFVMGARCNLLSIVMTNRLC